MKQALGIDIGGTKINGIVFDGKKVVRELTIVTPKTLFDFEKNILKLIDFLSTGFKINGIGIGMAGAVDAKKGIVVRSPNIPYVKKLNLAQLVQSVEKVQVVIDNDANCFTRAEMLLGQGKKFKNFILLTLGTGVGGGIVINKQLYRGALGTGAEFGHMVVNGEFMEKTFQRLRDRKQYNKLGILVGQSLVGLVNIFEPEGVIIGGGVISHSKVFLPPLISEIKKFIFDKHGNPKIIISQLKNAGALGAALLVK